MSRSIELHDRDEYKRSMRELLTIDPTKTVALTIDMQRDFLDPLIATAPVRADVAEKVVADTAAMLDMCREAGIPVVHCYVSRRPQEAGLGGHHAAYTLAGQRAGLSQNVIAPARTRVDRVAGSGGEEVMPALVRDSDFMMGNKREMDSFHLTDLEMILRRYLKPEVLLIAGINTDTCVYATTFGASVRGFRPVLIEECVASMRGADHHQMALELIAGSVAWVLSTAELRAKLAAAAAEESGTQLSGV
jgi:nicotinamidase-related amidase